jgi:eukaryotic-like serine/threonine-protein kinase
MSAPQHNQKTEPLLAKPDKSPLPKKIGPYKIEALLNSGHMSNLYLGLSEQGNPIVVKVLSPSLRENPSMTERFLKEAKIVAMADHPNIIKLLDQGVWEGGIYIAMEFIHGISLKAPILQNAFSEKKALQIALQVGYALCHLHAYGIIHRDLKPDNILMTNSGEVKVIDFGIALLDQRQFASSRIAFMGTPDYMSPEQKKNPQNVSFNTDIYALGIITYELLIGRLSMGIIQYELLPEGLRQTIQKATDPDPKKRTKDIVDFISAIIRYLEKEGFHPQDHLHTLDTISLKFRETQENLNAIKDLPKALKLAGSHFGGIEAQSAMIDIKRLDDGRIALAFLSSATPSFASSLQTAFGLGALRSKMSSALQAQELIYELGQLFERLDQNQLFSFALIIYSPALDSITYTTFGHASIWYLPNRCPPVKISKMQPFLGSPQAQSATFSFQNVWDDDHISVLFSPQDENKISDYISKVPFENLIDATSINTAFSKALHDFEKKTFPLFTLGKV